MSFPYGVDYYPEHWPEKRWLKDAELMNKAGFNIVRLAEFAWSKLEPRRGEYHFDWLDKAIEMLSAKGIKAVLGTPTAAPPPWIVKSHPDVLRIDGYGRRAAEATRKNYCPNNPVYIEFSKRIVEAMVLQYKSNPNIVGWQIDNEFMGDPCYCNNCIEAYRKWLKAKYGSLERLNEECGLIFWGQQYSDWDEIFPPRPPLTMQNPSLNLEWRRFTSDSWVKYQQEQVDVIRKHTSRQFITHNFMGMYKELDYFKLAENLDHVSFDYYPKWGAQMDLAPLAMCHDIMRSLKKRPYWIMELQSGAVVTSQAPIPLPGQIRLWTYQSIARGADGIVYFRWRTCRFGAEEYWHGILDHDGVPRRRYAEVKKTSEELRRITPYLERSIVKPQVAITLVYDNIWAWDMEVPRGDKNYYGESSWGPTLDCYGALYSRNVMVDFVEPTFENVEHYKAVFVPSLMLMDKRVEKNLRSYVEKGGILIATPRTGAKNWNNVIIEDTLPGCLSDVFGIEIEEYTGLPGSERVNLETVGTELTVQNVHAGRNWAEHLVLKDANALAYYQTGSYKSKACASMNKFGKGVAVYVGTFAEKSFYEDLVDWLTKKGSIKPVLPCAEGFEATERINSDSSVVFALNHTQNSISVKCSGEKFKDLSTGKEVNERINLASFGVKVLLRQK
ncbi:MAG: beta-galactosidase [Candidatus Bathyarchaeia archaeon]|nr:beta-galactosidase [Candidatus Bathyarchaeota archaeon]